MKTNRLRPAAVLLAAALSLNSFAQDENPPGGSGRMMPGGGAGAGPVMSVLTEEQRASMREALQAQREKMRELNTQLREARRTLMLAGLDGKFDEAAVRKQAQAVADLEVQVAVLRAKALSQIQPPLSPEQIQKIKNAMPGPAPEPGAPRPERPARRRILSEQQNRDASDLPPKP